MVHAISFVVLPFRGSSCGFLLIVFSLLPLSGFSQQVALESPVGTKMWVYTPPSYSSGNPAPLLLCLHGGSGIGDNLDMLTAQVDGSQNNGHLMPSRLIYNGQWDTSLPFIVVTPQLKRDESVPNYNDQRWPAALIDEVLEFVKSGFNVDEQRVYVTGISVGGSGAWTYAAAYPHKVAAIVPFSGVTLLEEACSLKDIPTWVFHGENDGLVVSEFSTNMVAAIKNCLPSGKLVPHASIIPTHGHEGWNEVYSGTTQYDIYTWLLKFRKSNLVNTAPFVTSGGDRIIEIPAGAFYITGDYFDSDGTMTDVSWTKVSGPSVILEQTNTTTLKLTHLNVGTYVFRLSVTDNDGASADDTMQLTVLSQASSLAISSISLTDADEQVIRVLLQDDVIDLTQIGTARINIVAEGTAGTRSIKFSVNAFDRISLSNTSTNTATLKSPNSDWKPTYGTYTLCATPYSANAGNGTQGTAQCYRITITSGTYYAKAGSDIALLSSWGTNPDGTGSAPASITAAPLRLIIPSSAFLGSSCEINESAILTVAPGATLTFNNRFFFIKNNIPVTFTNVVAESGSTIRIQAGPVVLSRLSPESTVIIESAANINIPVATYGTLILRGTGQRTFGNNALVTVIKKLTIQPGTNLLNNIQHSGQILVLGDAEIQGTGTFSSARPVPLRFGGDADHELRLGPSTTVLKGLQVHANGTLTILPENADGTLEISSSEVDDNLILHQNSTLKLNGVNLTLRNKVALNPDNQNGSVEVGNAKLVFATSTTRQSHLYPRRGHHETSALTVNIQGGGELFIRDSLRLTDYIRLDNGTVRSNGMLTLVSGATSAAFVAPVSGTGQILGSVQLEMFIKPGRTYRYVTFPVSGFTVGDLQQYLPVTGTFPQTSTGTGLSTKPSLYYYDEPNGGWIAYPKVSNTQPLTTGTGYAMFVYETSKPRKVIINGAVHTGDYTFSLIPDPDLATVGNGWNLVGNPYPASVRWAAEGWTQSGVNKTVYVRDNSVEGGRFLSWDGDTGDEDFAGILPAGQSFWVRTISHTPQLLVTEAAKVPDASQPLYRTNQTTAPPVLKMTLRNGDLVDNVYLKFVPDGKPAFDDHRDGLKQLNGYFNISVLTPDAAQVVIKNLSDSACTHTVGLRFQPSGQGTYSFAASGSAFERVSARLFLKDHFLDSLVSLSADTGYTFQVLSDGKSASTERFSLTVETSGLPEPQVTFAEQTLYSSYAKGNQWMLNGVDIPGAVSEAFEPLQEGEYSVRVTRGNCTRISPVFAFRVTSNSRSAAEITLYPNPADKVIFIEGLGGIQHGEWVITSATGMFVTSQLIEAHVERLEIPVGTLSPGVYFLQVTGSRGVNRFRFVVQ
jgi:poly(3-hydroxybutyrate) depolymerase